MSDPDARRDGPVVVKAAKRGGRRRVLPSPGTSEADRERDALRRHMEAELDARYEAGVRAGREAVEGELRGAIEAAVADLTEQSRALRETRARQVHGLEAAVLDIVLQITRKVLDRDVQTRPEIALRVLRSALIAVADQEITAIRVSPESIATFRHGVAALGDVVPDPEGVNWIPDRRVAPGGCVIETETGKVDATIGSQLDEAARILRDVLDGHDA